jgi:hypothetical protein
MVALMFRGHMLSDIIEYLSEHFCVANTLAALQSVC